MNSIENQSKPLIIPIFIPHLGCTHQCAFCNQSIIADKTDKPNIIPTSEEIRNDAEKFLNYRGTRKNVEIAFFGGSFLGLKPAQISYLLSSAQELVNENKIDSIRFSTRPDTIKEQTLELIAPYSVSTIELGVQSMNDRVLKAAKRGHTAEDTINAINLLKTFKSSLKAGVQKIGIQMMVGLPEDDNETSIETAYKIVSLAPAFIRIYPLIVLKGSPIAVWYQQGKYKPMDLGSCIKLVKEIFLIFEKNNIPVIRMGLQASDMLQDKLSMIAGPWHPAFGHLVYSEIFFDNALDLIEKIYNLDKSSNNFNKLLNPNDSSKRSELVLTVNPASLSRLKGDKNQNIKRLEAFYPSFKFKIKTDINLNKRAIKAYIC